MKKDEAAAGDERAPKVTRPYKAVRRERLNLLIAECGGPKALGLKVGTPDTHLTAMSKGRRDVGDDLATKLEEKTGKPVGWMDEPVTAKEPPPKLTAVTKRLEQIWAEDPERYQWAIDFCELFAFAKPPQNAEETLDLVSEVTEELRAKPVRQKG